MCGAAKTSVLDRYVTDEQRSSRPIFNATLRAAASWLFFRVARSTRMTQIWALRSRLEKQPTDLRRDSRDLGDGTLGHPIPKYDCTHLDYRANCSAGKWVQETASLRKKRQYIKVPL